MTQTYANFEIIVVNDRSTDATENVVRAFQQRDSRIVLISVKALTGDMPGKKNALATGIRSSKGEILCFTDADCVPSSTWIADLVKCFDDKVGVVAGYSPYDSSLVPADSGHGFWRSVLLKFIEGEEFKGAIWSAGAIGLNLAWLCTGRNLAYRRVVFDEVGGFEKIKMSISGDDDLLLQLVRRTTNWKIRYSTSPRSIVRTAPPSTFGEFVNQRTRHFSSGKYFTLPMKAFFFLFHFSNLLLLAGLVAAVLVSQSTLVAVAGFALKLTCDVLLWLLAFRALQIPESIYRFRFSDFLLTELLYVLYNSLIGPMGFLRTFDWKGSNIRQAA